MTVFCNRSIIYKLRLFKFVVMESSDSVTYNKLNSLTQMSFQLEAHQKRGLLLADTRFYL